MDKPLQLTPRNLIAVLVLAGLAWLLVQIHNIILLIFVALLILVLILLGIGFIANSGEKSASFFSDKKEEKINDGISLLILGRVAEGQGGQWHAAPNLTDAIVIAQYEPEKDVINLVSLPRDLYGEFGGETFKINEMYSRKKIEEFMEKLPEITGIEVENYLVVDVEITKTTVDKLGGIDVELTNTITDPVTGYKLEAGAHHLTGDDVVWVMRNRFAPEGDFFREKNQHNIIAAIFARFSAMSRTEKTAFMLSMAPYVKNTETNFSIGELAPRLSAVGKLSFNSVTLDFSTGLLVSSYIPVGSQTVGMTISDATGTPQLSSLQQDSGQAGQAPATGSRAYVLIPKDGINNYETIRKFIEEKLM